MERTGGRGVEWEHRVVVMSSYQAGRLITCFTEAQARENILKSQLIDQLRLMRKEFL